MQTLLSIRFLSSFVIARSVLTPKQILIKLGASFATSQRRSNLPSPTNQKEFFRNSSKITHPRSQSREIASRMQQRLTLPTVSTIHAEARNDEGVREGRTLRPSRQSWVMT